LHDWIQFVWPQKIKSDTGFVKPNLDKFANMVIYFVIKEKPCKTKLNKLLFYSDFLHYKNHLKAISGSRYRAISLGPVPTEYDAIYDWMNNNNFIYSFERNSANERVIVILNKGNENKEVHLPVKGKFTDVLNNNESYNAGNELKITVPAKWGRILRVQ